jgi:hypothetical protein
MVTHGGAVSATGATARVAPGVDPPLALCDIRGLPMVVGPRARSIWCTMVLYVAMLCDELVLLLA